MKEYNIEITGKTPLLMHQDNINWADYMDEWKNNPDNKKKSKAGDDRTPAWRWIGCVYHDNNFIGIPQDNIMKSLMEGGVMVPVPGGGKKTFKAQTQSGMMCVDPFWPITTNQGNTISWKEIEALKDVESFSDQIQKTKELGITLFTKRARISMSKHIRVRPMFDAGWSISGKLIVWDEQITKKALEQFLDYAGRYKGLGDWRPGGKTPGHYGMFEAIIK
jgi:hypothetical protein